jgi:hypothetical protein
MAGLSAMTLTDQLEHTDLLGRKVTLGDFVAFPQHNRIYVGRVLKLNKQMLRVERLKTARWLTGEVNKYSKDCVLLPTRDLHFYLLRNSSK